MPKIRIREIDKTNNQGLASNDNVIFLVDSGYTSNDVKLIETKDDFPSGMTLNEKDFIDKVIELGGKVIVASNYDHAVEYLKDRNQFDVKFLLATEQAAAKVEGSSTDQKAAKGASDTSAAEVATTDLAKAIDIATARLDCVVVYTKISENYDENDKNETTLLDKDIGGSFADSPDKTGKYVLSFYAKNLNVDNEEIEAGKAYILAYLNSIKTNPEWLAIAGSKRGLIPGDKDKIKVGFITEKNIDDMQPTAGKAAINPIVEMNPWGVRIWGNRTAYKSTTRGLTASSFANIRILLCDLKKRLYRAARKYQFEQNSDVLWVNFQAEVNSLLEEMVHSYGIAGYRWFREETKDRAKIAARLQIIPVEAVEDFDLTIELTDSLTVNE